VAIGIGIWHSGLAKLEHSSQRTFSQKTKFLAQDLHKWRKCKPKLTDQLATIKNQLLQQQAKSPNQQDFDLQSHLTHQHHQLLAKDEEFRLQRAKKNWAKLGDRNIAYFHQAIVKRHRKNTINFLQNPDGTESTTPEQLATTLLEYFTHIFATTNTTHAMINTAEQHTQDADDIISNTDFADHS
jgi:hypothetical protein